MKKLALIVLLAVVASRVLADRDDRPESPPPPPTSILRTLFHDDAPPPDRPKPPRPPWGHRPKRVILTTANPANPKVAPAWFPKSEWEEAGLARSDASGSRILIGRLSVSEERARLDLRKTLNHEVADWLAADIPMTWNPPGKLVDEMIQGTYVQTVTRSIGPKSAESATETLPNLDELHIFYRAGQKLDFSEDRKAEFLARYHRDVASARMRKSGAILAVALASLALFSLYVRTDEATKGYYTNRLRTLGLVGLGAAGAVAYRYWT